MAVGLVLLAAGACGGPADDGPAGPSPGPGDQRPAADVQRLVLTFDPGDGDRGVVVRRNGGTVEMVPGAPGHGLAAAFPASCAATTGCPRALVEVAPDAALAPGTNPFGYGAMVWLAPDQTTTGSNIVQQGRFGTPGGQWKLQVDDEAGRPSCVVRSDAGEVTVRSDVSVADGEWHRVVCRRDATGVSIEVDGSVERVDVATGAVSGSAPIRVGSPGVGDQDDQFHGRVDDVFLEVERGT